MRYISFKRNNNSHNKRTIQSYVQRKQTPPIESPINQSFENKIIVISYTLLLHPSSQPILIDGVTGEPVSSHIRY